MKNKRVEELYQQVMRNDELPYAGTLLEQAALRWPDRVALIFQDTKKTFANLYRHAFALTQRLAKEYKLTTDDRVLVLCENNFLFHIMYYGAWQTGAIVAPLNTFLHEREIAYIIEDANPKLILCSPKQYERLIAMPLHVPILTYSEEEALQPIDESSPLPELPKINQDADDLAALLYTSGTTGKPKAVMLTSRAIISNTIQGISNFDVGGDERILAILPLFHSYMQNTAVWSPMIAGASVVLVPQISRKDIIEGLDHKPTAVLGIPQLFGLFCQLRTLDFSHVKLFVSGGDALPDKIRMAFELIYNRKICNGYGLTECAPFIAVSIEDRLTPTHLVGKPMYEIEVSLRSSNGRKVPAGKVGELWVKGPNLTLGYYNAPEATAEVLEKGWLKTGDLARISCEGDIIIAGRKKDLIVHKGFNIYPAEIENVLTSHPDVLQAAVIGKVTDDQEIPVAFVSPRKELDVEKLRQKLFELCRTLLAPYKVPVEITVEKNLPLNATGKIDKKKLRENLGKE